MGERIRRARQRCARPAAMVAVLAAALLSFRVGDSLARWLAGHVGERTAQGGIQSGSSLQQVRPKPPPVLRLAVAGVSVRHELCHQCCCQPLMCAQAPFAASGTAQHRARLGCSHWVD